MNPQEKFDRFVEKFPHPHCNDYQRPHLSRRNFLSLAGAGLTMGYLATPPLANAGVKIVTQPVTPRGTAKNCIFILMTGAPSHTDIMDFKASAQPASFAPTTSPTGILWPQGLMPKMFNHLNNVSIVRSMRAWALVHTLAQTWTQIGRNPAAVLGNVAPNIGSIVAIEKDSERLAGQVFPTFISLNNGASVGNGYLPASFAPMKLNEPNGANANNTGIANTANRDGQTVSTTRYSQLQALDSALRTSSPYGKPLEDMANFYASAVGLEYNPTVTNAFTYTAANAARYGGTSFGNSCLVASQVLAAHQGTRFIQISVGGWDMHTNIYTGNNLVPGNANALSTTFDNGLSALIDDLSAAGILNETLIVCVGEFGRTVGSLTGAAGRDHYPQQSVMFIGGGMTGGRVIGSTDATGSKTVDPGWTEQRDVKPEDVEATIYSALGINWTSIRYDDPLGRGFEYVPFASAGVYKPIDALWT